MFVFLLSPSLLPVSTSIINDFMPNHHHLLHLLLLFFFSTTSIHPSVLLLVTLPLFSSPLFFLFFHSHLPASMAGYSDPLGSQTCPAQMMDAGLMGAFSGIACNIFFTRPLFLQHLNTNDNILLTFDIHIICVCLFLLFCCLVLHHAIANDGL